MPNLLIHEQSPYLLQHAHNPVNWFPWGDEPFLKAKKEDKLVIVSIGYSACHWCHVMERESFEDATTAAFMNKHFVCIKVDREEHPDVDQVYMDAIQALTGSGGWPLNVFVTPDRKPFYGGTYFPPKPAFNRPSWMQLMERMQVVWKDHRIDIETQSTQIISLLQNASEGVGKMGEALTSADFKEMASNLLKTADKEWGGFGNAPKFPGTLSITFLLDHHYYFGNKEALGQALLSLNKMIEGGIYDQLGGGFSRYSTDRTWLAPHFEKMLYDNALIISTLCDAYKYTGETRYRKTILETIAFVQRELQAEYAGFYCALDADSEGEEGRFYTWTYVEWIKATNGGNAFAEAYFGIKKEGNWEGTNILHEAIPLEELCAQFRISEQEGQEKVCSIKDLLWAERLKRIRPQTDDKILLSWNALMNSALSKAGIILEDSSFLEAAERHMQWLKNSFFDASGNIFRVWKGGKSRLSATLEDLAYLMAAMIDLASFSGRLIWLQEANTICKKVWEDFAQTEDVFFFFSSRNQQDLPVRKIDVYDTALPSANAVMARVLLQLGMVMERTDWYSRGEEMLQKMASNSKRYTGSFSHWACWIQRDFRRPKTVLVTGQNAEKVSQELSKKSPVHCLILPLTKGAEKLPLTAGKECEGDSLIFVCTSAECFAPVSSMPDALQLL
ncbi:MAG: thioredoxin domain-containing protein [Chitinophagaceae bacterium]